MSVRLLTRVSAAIANWQRMEAKAFQFEQIKAARLKQKAEAKKHRSKERGGIEVTKQGLVRCRVCHCSEIEPCHPPCSLDRTAGICSTCSEAVAALFSWADGANRAYLSNLVVEFRRLTVRRVHNSRVQKQQERTSFQDPP